METILPQQLGAAPLLAKERNDVPPGLGVSAESAERKGRDHIFLAAPKAGVRELGQIVMN
jgi:hypothetical protein